MKEFLSIHRFSMRLLLGFVALIFLTTLSAGLPAYWLTRLQLEQQAWFRVNNAQMATQSLLIAEQTRLASQLALFAERPTLQELTQSQVAEPLQLYMRDFRSQSGLDFLIVYTVQNELLASDGTLTDDVSDEAEGFLLKDGRPLLVARQIIVDERTDLPLGTAVAGIWLEDRFLQQLVNATGMQQSIIRLDGQRLSTSFAPINTIAPITSDNLADLSEESREIVTLNENIYYAAYRPLNNSRGQTMLLSEVALQVNDLVLTGQRAFLILAVSTLSVAILGSILSVWFVRQVNAPLRKLTTTAEKISQGDLVAPIPLFSGPVEIRTLAAALHRSQASMLGALQEKSEVGERLNALLQSLVEGIITYDVAGKITFWSNGAQAILGWSPEEAIGKHIDEVFILSEDENKKFLRTVPRSGQKRQIGVLSRIGKPIILALTDSQLIPPGSSTFQVALVFRDVTEEEAVRRLRSYFLANISHEFRTPLSTLNASMEMLLDEGEEFTLAEVRQLLKPTHLSLLSLQNLINNLLESSSIEAGQLTLRRQIFSIYQIVDEAIIITRPLLQRRQQELLLPDEPELVEIEGDQARLTQVLVNLIINASKYSPIGQSIELQLSQQGNKLYVGIVDHGPGIPPEERSNIFRSFVRLDFGDKEQPGIGLGLFVVKSIIEGHGGEIGVSDTADGGALFWFEIPQRQ